jgi:hypothetical protein
MAPLLSAQSTTKSALFFRFLRDRSSSLLVLLLGGIDFQRITMQSCLMQSLSSSSSVFIFSSMHQMILSTGIEEGETGKLKYFSRTLILDLFS